MRKNDSQFKIGHMVRLKSGGPTMTVTYVDGKGSDDDEIQCSWFVNTKQGYSEKAFVQKFSRSALVRVG